MLNEMTSECGWEGITWLQCDENLSHELKSAVMYLDVKWFPILSDVLIQYRRVEVCKDSNVRLSDGVEVFDLNFIMIDNSFGLLVMKKFPVKTFGYFIPLYI